MNYPFSAYYFTGEVREYDDTEDDEFHMPDTLWGRDIEYEFYPIMVHSIHGDKLKFSFEGESYMHVDSIIMNEKNQSFMTMRIHEPYNVKKHSGLIEPDEVEVEE